MKKRIVTTTSVFEPGYPAEKAARRLKKLGFEALDMALDYWKIAENSPFMGEGYLQWAEEQRSQAEAAGISYTHAHAPGDAVNNPHIGRSIETAGALGAKYLVLHPVCRGEDGEILEDRAEFIRLNAEAVRPWLELAQRCGVVILSENLLGGASADPRVIAELVQEVKSPWFGWCFDTGHANCFGYGAEVLKECSVPPLSLHIQDNHGTMRDEHLIPGDGTVNWESFLRTLREVEYAGDCVLEAHHQSLEAPDAERDAILNRLLQAAQELKNDMKS